MAGTAFKTFSLSNDIYEVPPEDEIYKYDKEANSRLLGESPWTRE